MYNPSIFVLTIGQLLAELNRTTSFPYLIETRNFIIFVPKTCRWTQLLGRRDQLTLSHSDFRIRLNTEGCAATNDTTTNEYKKNNFYQ